MSSTSKKQNSDLKKQSLRDSSNKRIINSNIIPHPRRTYNYESENNYNLNDSKLNNCLSEENNIPLSRKTPSIASLSEEDNYNTYAKKLSDTNGSNDMKKINNNQNYFRDPRVSNDILYNLNSNLNLNKPTINYLEYKLAQLNSELVAINSDNLMLKEDIYKYMDINKYLENEIKIQNEHNIDLLNTNNKLIEENNELNDRLNNDTNEFNELIEQNEAKQKEYDEKQKMLEIKDIKVNTDYDELVSINNKTKEDYNILSKNFDELNKKNKCLKEEMENKKEIQSQNFSEIEEKIDGIMSEIEILKNEQNALNKENIENKKKLDEIQNQKKDYFNKYNDEMALNEKLNKELYANRINFETAKKRYFENKEKNSKKAKKRPASLIKKQELIKELQKKIDDYKRKTLRYSYMDD